MHLDAGDVDQPGELVQLVGSHVIDTGRVPAGSAILVNDDLTDASEETGCGEGFANLS
jgi:hypothetical protein